MNILDKTITYLLENGTFMYINEISDETGYKVWQIAEVLVTLMIVGIVRKKNDSYGNEMFGLKL